MASRWTQDTLDELAVSHKVHTLKPIEWPHLAESPAVEVLRSLGYTYASPEDLETGRPSLKEPILTNRLATTLKRLNPCLSDTNVTKAVKAVTQVPAASLSGWPGCSTVRSSVASRWRLDAAADGRSRVSGSCASVTG